MTELAQNKCEACSGRTLKSTPQEIEGYLKELSGWEVVDGHHLLRRWNLRDFAQAIAKVNAIGAVAEQEGHHPDIRFGWGYLEVIVYTHAIDGLSKSDFILAAKIDAI